MQNETARQLLSIKINSTTKDPNTCIEEQLSNNEFQKIIVKMTSKKKQKNYLTSKRM
jgi:hypothetical protein